MIVVKIEMWPGGNESAKTDLGRIEIANDVAKTMTTNGSRGDYKCKLFERGGKRFWKGTKVMDFPRRQRNAYDLLYRVLKQTVGERNE